MNEIQKKIDAELRRPNAGKNALCNQVADVASVIAENAGNNSVPTLVIDHGELNVSRNNLVYFDDSTNKLLDDLLTAEKSTYILINQDGDSQISLHENNTVINFSLTNIWNSCIDALIDHQDNIGDYMKDYFKLTSQGDILITGVVSTCELDDPILAEKVGINRAYSQYIVAPLPLLLPIFYLLGQPLVFIRSYDDTTQSWGQWEIIANKD